MQEESLSAKDDLDFDGYDTEPFLEEMYKAAETLTLQAICASSVFQDLFDDAECISRIYGDENPSEKDKNEPKGVYFVFRAHDAVTGRNIAIKATNPAFSEEHPHLQKCLEWESAVLTHLKGKDRIQQISVPLKTTQIVLDAGDEKFREEVSFFSSEYLGVDVKKSFFDQTNDRLKTCANRLRLFCSIISAVQSLHREGICHRDLKPSNVMGIRKDGKCKAVLIDLGLSLAAKKIQDKLQLYAPQVEVPKMYAAPELYSGFEGNLPLAQSADIYSLGCMLFELLDKRTFYAALLETNGQTYHEVVKNIRVEKEECHGDDEKRLELYNSLLSEFAPAIIIPRLLEDSILPEYARSELQSIINEMCSFDHQKRAKENELDGIKEKLRHIIHILENAHLRKLYKKRKEIHLARKAVSYA